MRQAPPSFPAPCRPVAVAGLILLVGCGGEALPREPGGASGSGGGTSAAECAAPARDWIWCDDFEEDRFSAYFEVMDAGGNFQPRDGAGVAGSRGMVARFREGTQSAGALHLAFGRTPQPYFDPVDGGGEDHRRIFWRFYLQLPVEWVGNGGYKLARATVFSSPDHWGQAMAAHLWSGRADGPNALGLVLDPASGTDAEGRVVTAEYNDFQAFRWLGVGASRTKIFDREHRGRWHCIEAGVGLNDPGASNGTFRLWIDGELEAERIGLDWVGRYDEYGLNALFIENYWDGGAPTTQERVFDNLVVSRSRIGCLSDEELNSP